LTLKARKENPCSLLLKHPFVLKDQPLVYYSAVKVEKLTKVTSQEIGQALSRWDMAEMPSYASITKATERKAESELAMSNWLYDLVRRNVKRGRLFLLKDILVHQQADCLGYAKLLSCLGKKF